MFNKLEEIIKKIKGNVLVIGIDNNLLNKFDKNNNVNLYSIYSDAKKKSFSNSKKRKTNKGKSINIKKLRKYINKKSVDYLFINYEEIVKYYKYIIKDTIYLNNNMIYIYFSTEYDKEFIIGLYNRYNVKINCVDYKNGCLLSIDNKNGKNNFIKDKLYFLKDTFYNIAEAIGNILIN